MTTLIFDLRTSSAAGRQPSTGRVAWQRVERLVDGTVVVLPAEASVALVDGTATAEIDGGYYWFTEKTTGGARRLLSVPASGPADYATLAEVDPLTLEPSAAPDPAWVAMAGSTVTSGSIVGDDLVLRRTDGTTVDAGNVRGPVGPMGPAPWVKLADLATPIYGAHRAGANVAPEQTPEALNLAASYGAPVIDLDVWGSMEGVPYAIHDQTLDRTTKLTGNVSDRSASELQIATVDPSAWHSPGWPDTRLLTLDEVLRRYGGRTVLSIEIKDTRTSVGTNAVDLIKRYGLTKSVIVNSYSLAALTPFVAAGIETMFNNDSYGTTPAALLAAGVTWMGASAYVTTDAQITDALSKGMKVCVYTVERQTERARYAAMGVQMIMGDDPVYVQGDPSKYRRTVTSFGSLLWGHGILPSTSRSATTCALNAAGEMVLMGSSSLEPSVLIGEVSPVANPGGSYSITASLRLVSASTWAAVCFAVKDDRIFKAAGTQGYMVLIRNTGSMELFKVTDNTGTLLTSAATTAIAAGGTATLKVDVSPTGITVTRTDTAAVSINSTDASYRGGYVHVSKQNATSEVRFSSLAVS